MTIQLWRIAWQSVDIAADVCRTPLAERISAASFHPPVLDGPMPRPGGPVRTHHEAGELLRGMREEERR
ncbi:hypothetical protein [Gandjariella thermophila]|uniref:hypothetical protein n=1 Tax=Gandjariella thermophila TaxID=1931992 RepID=UPI001863D1EC|nr:hypothetical protein [Gandjariella thermophila]